MNPERFSPDTAGARKLVVGMLPAGILIAIILLGLYLLSLQNFILFHSIVELAGIAVAVSIFIIVWNTKENISDAFFLIVGISFLFIGGIDLIHTLAYKGMGVFPGNDPNIPTQLWIAARYFQSITFLAATLFVGRFITRDRHRDTGLILAGCTAATGLILASIFVWQNFPACFIEGTGLTPFKIFSEYLISLFLAAAIVVLYLKRRLFDPEVWKLLVLAQVFLVLGELAFTSYISVYGFMNMLGHLFRLISVYLFYRVFVVISLTRPFDQLLRQIREDEHALNERFKELNCLYGISTLIEQKGSSLPAILEGTVALLPPAMQYPAVCGARIVFGGQQYQTPGFAKTPWMLSRKILLHGTTAGSVEVCYREERPASDEGPFLKEERDLVNAVAERIGHLTERYRAEEALKESEQKYRTLFDTMLEGFAYCRMIYDDSGEPADWEYLEVNRAFSDLTGLQDIKGRRARDAIPGIRELNPELFVTYGRVARTGVPEVFEISFLPLKMWMRVSVYSPQKDFFVAVFEDITKRHEAEAAIKESEELYRSILRASPDDITITSMDGIIRMVSPRALSIFGYADEKELLGRSIDEFLVPEDRARARENIALMHQGTFTGPGEYRALRRDGAILDIEANADFIRNAEGSPAMMIFVIRDISERKRAEKAFIEINRKLNLLSSITRHDIRNQLFSLKAYLELSREALGNPAQLAEYILKEERAADAIERQITFTKEYQDLGVHAPVWQNVGDCVDIAAASLPMREIRVENQARNLEVYADPLFAKVFYNLIDNALRYGGPKMTAITLSAEEAGAGIVISVSDDGEGIAVTDRKRLFERGFGHHTGLGLFLSREILSITGITITENGEPGNGARFEITVPAGEWRKTAERPEG